MGGNLKIAIVRAPLLDSAGADSRMTISTAIDTTSAPSPLRTSAGGNTAVVSNNDSDPTTTTRQNKAGSCVTAASSDSVTPLNQPISTAVSLDLVAASDDSDAASSTDAIAAAAAAVTDESDSASVDELPTTEAYTASSFARVAVGPQDATSSVADARALHDDDKQSALAAVSRLAARTDLLVADAITTVETTRKRKRKRYVFSNSRYKQKRLSAGLQVQTQQPHTQLQIQRSQAVLPTESQLLETPASSEHAATTETAVTATDRPESPLPLGESTALYGPTTTEAAWDWRMSDAYYTPVTQNQLAYLTRVRQQCANVLAANVAACAGLRQAEPALFAAVLRDATDIESARVEVAPRGRRYRDVWAERDFLAAVRRREALVLDKPSVVGSATATAFTAFGTHAPLRSYHDLVRNYDDAGFEQFLQQLELGAVGDGEADAHDDVATADASRQRSDAANVPSQSSATDSSRHSNTVSTVSSFTTTTTSSSDNVAEDDEIARAITASLAQLLPLAAHNWREAQTVYERAAAAAQCEAALEREAALATRVEALYRRLYPPLCVRAGSLADNTTTTALSLNADVDARTPVFHSRRAHLVAHSAALSSDRDEAQCVAASVEFALTLAVGDEVDVLDCHGCWSAGVVVDEFREHGQLLKFVRLQLVLWPASVAEWVSVTAGRVLPRGVATGELSLVISSGGCCSAARARSRRVVRFDRALADTLERTLSARLEMQQTAARERSTAAAATGVAAVVSRRNTSTSNGNKSSKSERRLQSTDDRQHRKRVKKTL